MYKRVAIIGAGFYGCAIANRLQNDFDVVLIDKNQNILEGVAKSNVFRIHRGPHYPRSKETARQCLIGYSRFIEEFSSCITTSFSNLYAISKEGSKTSIEKLFEFCDQLKIPHKKTKEKHLSSYVTNCEGGIFCEEGTFNLYKLRDLYLEKLSRCKFLLNQEALDIEKNDSQFIIKTVDYEIPVDIVINCSFTNMNLGCFSLRFEPKQYLYQKTLCFKVKNPSAKYGITILDGEFPTVFPNYWNEKSHKLDASIFYHVIHSVLEQHQSYFLPVYKKITDEQINTIYKKIKKEIFIYLPFLSALTDFEPIFSNRIIRPSVKQTGSRVSEFYSPYPNHYIVLNGKIDYSLCLADQLLLHLKQES